MSAPVLALRGLTKAYRPGQPVLHGLNLDISEEGLVAIIGPSGTGKSTLIRCINRLVDPSSGEILLRGVDMAQLKGRALREARRHIAMVFQESNLVERLSVIENVLCGRLGTLPLWRPLLRRFEPQDIEQAFDLLASVGLDPEFATRRADALSGGQRQRVGLARALYGKPVFVVLDEPNSSLDEAGDAALANAIAALKQLGTTFVVMTHRSSILGVADKILLMREGAQQAFGPRDEVLAALQQKAQS